MIAEALDIDEEKYFAIVMDRDFKGPVMVASPEGGEAVSARGMMALLKRFPRHGH